MFEEVRVPILGIIENMSYLIATDGSKHTPFGSGGGKKLANEIGVPFLGEIPIDQMVSTCGDSGEPIVRKHPEHAVSKAYIELAATMLREVPKLAVSGLPAVDLG